MSVCCEVNGAKVPAPALQTSQDRKDLEKLTKFFALKSAQVIVQARLGEKINTECNPKSTQTEWFNMVIKDIPEIQTEAKKAMGNSGPQLPFCVEISLRTNEQESMILETWYIKNRTDMVDPAVRMTCSLYNRMTLMLKSLLTLTRVTPAYKLSRDKSADYIMCYRIYVGEPQLFGLGSDYKCMNVGEVCTLLGTLQLAVAYRTKLTISPQQNRSATIMVKDDHFPQDATSPTDNKKPSDVAVDDYFECKLLPGLRFPAFADRWDLRWVEPEPVEIPFAHLLPKPKVPPTTEDDAPSTSQENGDTRAHCSKDIDNQGKDESKKNDSKKDDSKNGNAIPWPSYIPAHHWSQKDIGDMDFKEYCADPFVEIRPLCPFAEPSYIGDLGLFFRRCQNAPPLKTFMHLLDKKEDEMKRVDISKELVEMEAKYWEYQEVFKTYFGEDEESTS